MRARAILLGGAITASVLAANCLPWVGNTVAERAHIPDHVYEEAERQLDVFVAWARNDAAVPDIQPDDVPVQ